jgi:DNA modification methylase
MTTLIHGDSAKELSLMRSQSVELVVTSPPYDDIRSYGAGNGKCDWNFEGTASGIQKVLVEGGICCWIVGDQVVGGSETLTSCKQKIFFREVMGMRIHDTMIYRKKNFSHPERSRYHQVFEYVFVFSKGQPRCFNPLIDRKNLTAGCVGNLGVNTFTERDGSKSERTNKVIKEFGMRHNVWEGLTRGQEDMCIELKHPAMMPKWLARDLILSFSNPGDTVLDPMAGSGTTLTEAVKSGRNAAGIESNLEYFKELQSACNVTARLAL